MQLLRHDMAYQPVDEVLSRSSTHKMSWPKLRRPTLCSGVIAEQRLRQRAVTRRAARRLSGRNDGRILDNSRRNINAIKPLALGTFRNPMRSVCNPEITPPISVDVTEFCKRCPWHSHYVSIAALQRL